MEVMHIKCHSAFDKQNWEMSVVCVCVCVSSMYYTLYACACANHMHVGYRVCVLIITSCIVLKLHYLCV